MTKYSFVIEGKLPSQNEMAPSNWKKYAQLKKKATNKVAKAVSHLPKLEIPIKLMIRYYPPNKRIDKDNIAAAKKFILDGLVKAGKISNDGWKEIDCWEETFEVDRANARVEVDILVGR